MASLEQQVRFCTTVDNDAEARRRATDALFVAIDDSKFKAVNNRDGTLPRQG
jgi:hypothetical protein